MDFTLDNETEDSDIEDENEWKEIDEIDEDVECLFCFSVFNSFAVVLQHCREIHNVDFKHLKSKFNMDCYSFIKLINFIRKTSTSPEDLIKAKFPLWNDEIYLKPVREFDPWLTFDFEDYYGPEESEKILNASTNGTQLEQKLVAQLQTKLIEREEELSALKNQINQMKKCVSKMLQDDTSNGRTSDQPLTVDSTYFDSYSGAGIHHEMLSDSVRTRSYRDAIIENEPIFSGKTVLDLGCGTGILSMFAASTSSQKVYAVDNSDIIFYATEIIRENNLQSKIDIIKGRIEDEHIEIEKVDIIVSEWMGYFLLFEGMLDSLVYARDHYLKPGGTLLPDSCGLFMCGANDPDGYKNYVEFWSDVYGYRMSSIKREIIKEAAIDVISADKIITSEALISSFNLYTCTVADTSFSTSFELHCNADAAITTLVGYFDAVFNLQNRVHFSTGPASAPTHWKQTLFYIPEPISCKKGEKFVVDLTCARCIVDKRSLKVTIKIDNHEYVYNVR